MIVKKKVDNGTVTVSIHIHPFFVGEVVADEDTGRIKSLSVSREFDQKGYEAVLLMFLKEHFKKLQKNLYITVKDHIEVNKLGDYTYYIQNLLDVVAFKIINRSVEDNTQEWSWSYEER